MKKNEQEKLVREEGHGKIRAFMDNPRYSSSCVYKDTMHKLLHGESVSGWDISFMDFAKLEHLNNSQIQHLLSNLFKTHDIAHPQEQFFDLSTSLLTPEGINHINRILNEAVEYYQHYLLRTIGDSFVQKWNKKKTGKAEIALKTTQDVIDFFQQSSSQKNTTAYRQIHCSLLKIAFCMNDYAMHEDKLAEAENTFHTIKHDAIYPHFYDHRNQRLTKDVPEDANNEYMLLRTDAAVSGKRAISFKNSGRVKKKNKMMLKMIENPKYNDILRPKDLYGLRNEVSTPEDALFLLEYFWVHVFDRQGDIVNKKMFGATPEINLAFLERYRDSLDTDFYDYLHGVFSADSERAAPTGKNNKKYQEIKIIGHIAGYPYPIETQINLVNNKNESGYAHHTIYDAKAKIRAMVRLQSYIPESIIYRYINEAIQTEMSEAIHAGKSSQLLGLGGYHGDPHKANQENKQAAAKKIFAYLLDHDKLFVPLSIPGENERKIYTVSDYWNTFQSKEELKTIYPSASSVKYNNDWTIGPVV